MTVEKTLRQDEIRQDEIRQDEIRQDEIRQDEIKQDEIDALFQAARSPSPEGEPAEGRAAAVPYNYAAAGQISTDQLRAISLLNDLFARNLTHNLAAWLRTRFQVNLVSAEQIPFNEFLLRIPEICYVASVRLDPLGALSVLQLDLALAPPIIDLLLGGEGRDGPLRELTDIEESILGSVVEIVCRELTAAWQTVGLSFTFDRRQMQTQVARLMSVTEKTLCLSFEIRMPHGSGLLNLAFPAVVANTILRRLATDWGKRRRHAGGARAAMEAAARRIRFGCSLQLPSVRLPASALEELAPGSLVRLNLPANTAPLWRVAGQPLHAAQAIRQGPHRAARIEHSLIGSPAPSHPSAGASPLSHAGKSVSAAAPSRAPAPSGEGRA
jgi:flagellar motor switch protein FliM